MKPNHNCLLYRYYNRLDMYCHQKSVKSIATKSFYYFGYVVTIAVPKYKNYDYFTQYCLQKSVDICIYNTITYVNRKHLVGFQATKSYLVSCGVMVNYDYDKSKRDDNPRLRTNRVNDACSFYLRFEIYFTL